MPGSVLNPITPHTIKNAAGTQGVPAAEFSFMLIVIEMIISAALNTGGVPDRGVNRPTDIAFPAGVAIQVGFLESQTHAGHINTG